MLLAVAALLYAGCDAAIQPQEGTGDEEKTIIVTVSYDGNGATGGATPASKEYESGSLATVAGNTGGLSRLGYVFSGWNSKADGSGTTYSAGSTFKTGPSNVTLYAAWVQGSLLVALSASGDVWLSDDGTDWDGPYATGLSAANGIVHSKGLFAVAGQDGTNYATATSPDGYVWTKHNLGGASAQLTTLSLDSAGSFVAAGVYGVTVETFSSLDGLAWAGPFSTGIPNAVGPGWSGSAWFIASSSGGTWKKSVDGENWDGAGLGGTSMYQAYTVGSVAGRILLGGGAPGGANKQVAVSSNGGAGFGATVNVNTAAGYVFAFVSDEAAARILSLGSGSSAQVNYSDDFGATWTASTGTGTGGFKAGVKWKNGFLVGDSSGNIYESADGSAFTVSGSAGTSEIRGIAYNGIP